LSPAADQPAACDLADPAALQAEADRLYSEHYRLGNEADLAMARSEIVLSIFIAQADLANAEADVAAARDRLAAATATYDPLAADLARAEADLAATEVIEGDYEQRKAKRMHRIAAEQEAESLRPQADQAGRAVRDAQAALLSLERDWLPDFRARVAETRAAYECPPLLDFEKLAKVAPQTAMNRGARIGLLLMLGSVQADWRTPGGRIIRVGLGAYLDASSLRAQMHDEWLDDLYREVGPKLAGKIRETRKLRRDLAEAARRPPDRGLVGDEYRNQVAALARPAGPAQLGPDRFPVLTDGTLPSLPGSPQQGDLPPVGSPGALESIARERRAAASDRRRMTGRSWQTYPN
jgi:hypothetical protein